MRGLKNPTVLVDGDHFKVEYEKREHANNKVEIIHVIHKQTGRIDEHYSSNYSVQSETQF
jgi:hypothetical protein